MIVGWTRSELLHLKDEYRLRIKNEKNKNEKENLTLTLASIDAVIDYQNNFYKSYEPKGLKTNIVNEEDMMFLQDFGFYAPYVRDFNQRGECVDDHFDNKKIETLALGIIDKVKDFYSSIGGTYKENFLKLIKGSRLRIRFIDNLQKETGATFPIYNTDIIYMFVGRINTFQDYITTTHECAHGMSCIMNPNGILSYDRYLFQETMSIFFETIANDELSEKLGLAEEGKKIKIDSYNDYLRSAKLICAKMDMLSALSYKQLKNDKYIHEYFRSYYGLDDGEIKIITKEGIPFLFVYVISYLTAMELYLIYQDDKEKALAILEKMVLAQQSDPRVYLKMVNNLGIVPGQNIERYQKILLQDRKTLKKNT